MKPGQTVAADVRRRTGCNMHFIRLLTSAATQAMKLPAYDESYHRAA